MTPDALRLFIPATISFLIGIGLTPFLTHFLYQHRLWKPVSGKKALDGTQAEIFNQLHKNRDTGVPRFGGVIVWGSVLLTAGLISLLGFLFPSAFGTLSFISRNQTWVPLMALIFGALVGLLDDTFEVQGRRGLPLPGGDGGRPALGDTLRRGANARRRTENRIEKEKTHG